ncbi:MAG: D-cysteine desulfhydrase family protein [Thermoprotei archaeon]
MFWRIYEYPRIGLFTKPTPLEKLENYSREYGVSLYVKRDDVMEIGFGGNKARKLEFILGDALKHGADIVITRGSYYSNHVRLTAIAAAKHGLKTVIVTYPPHENARYSVQGNILLYKLAGAEVVTAKNSQEADKLMEEIAEEYRRKGHNPYIIPVGGSSPHGVLGYVDAVHELLLQFRDMDTKPDTIVLATGTGTTQAGLILGLKLLGVRGVRVIGVDIEGVSEGVIENRVMELIEKTADMIGAGIRVSEDDVNVLRGYSFGGYGKFNRELLEFIIGVLKREGLLLEPVYTGKAFYALRDMIEKGEVKRGEKIVFIHTGGTPLVFQFAEEFGELVR